MSPLSPVEWTWLVTILLGLTVLLYLQPSCGDDHIVPIIDGGTDEPDNLARPSHREVRAADVHLSDTHLIVDLADGRVLQTPLVRFPRLASARSQERRGWVLIGEGTIIHWPAIDEDIEVAHLLR